MYYLIRKSNTSEAIAAKNFLQDMFYNQINQIEYSKEYLEKKKLNNLNDQILFFKYNETFYLFLIQKKA